MRNAAKKSNQTAKQHKRMVKSPTSEDLAKFRQMTKSTVELGKKQNRTDLIGIISFKSAKRRSSNKGNGLNGRVKASKRSNIFKPNYEHFVYHRTLKERQNQHGNRFLGETDPLAMKRICRQNINHRSTSLFNTSQELPEQLQERQHRRKMVRIPHEPVRGADLYRVPKMLTRDLTPDRRNIRSRSGKKKRRRSQSRGCGEKRDPDKLKKFYLNKAPSLSTLGYIRRKRRNRSEGKRLNKVVRFNFGKKLKSGFNIMEELRELKSTGLKRTLFEGVVDKVRNKDKKILGLIQSKVDKERWWKVNKKGPTVSHLKKWNKVLDYVKDVAEVENIEQWEERAKRFGRVSKRQV